MLERYPGVLIGGLFIPAQSTADQTKMIPVEMVARLDLWRTLAGLAEIAAGASVPKGGRIATAEDWQLQAAPNDPEPELLHSWAGLSFILTPFE